MIRILSAMSRSAFRAPWRRAPLLLALAFLFPLAARAIDRLTPAIPDGKPHQFEARDEKFWMDGKPMQLLAGELHFGRVLPEDWELRLQQARAMGLNTVSFYLFWNLCEPREGQFTFRGDTDVRRMLRLCQKYGLWVVLRPGPYCCAEVEYGGIPWWTVNHPDVKIRTNDPTYVGWSLRYLEAVYRQVSDLQVSRGGPLLMVQLENEYMMVAKGDNGYLRTLEKMAREIGFTVPLFTCDPLLLPETTPEMRVTGLVRGRNGLKNDKDLAEARQANCAFPVYVPELYTAWFSGWGNAIARRHASLEETVSWTRYLLEHDVSFCCYMFFGGTTYGFFNGSNEHLPVQTSYDYSAPIDEAGRVTEKYRALRTLLAEKRGVSLPLPPRDPPVAALPTIALTEASPLLNQLPARPTRVAEKPLSMEQLGQAFGFVLYRKTFPDGLHGTLRLEEARDYTTVLLNGRPVRRAFLGYGRDTSEVTLDEAGPATLDLLVYNLGRISVITSAQSQALARKGLVGGAYLDGRELTGWTMYSLPCDEMRNLSLPPLATSNAAADTREGPVTPPTLYRGTFTVSSPAGTFLDLRNWNFGAVWVNGHNLGHYWNRGALRSLFLPAHWLKRGKNEIVVLELEGPPQAPTIPTATRLIEEPAVPFALRLDRRNP